MFRELLQRIISFKEVSMIYKLSLVYIKSHYAFKSECESVYIQSLLPTVLGAWMSASREVFLIKGLELSWVVGMKFKEGNLSLRTMIT